MPSPMFCNMCRRVRMNGAMPIHCARFLAAHLGQPYHVTHRLGLHHQHQGVAADPAPHQQASFFGNFRRAVVRAPRTEVRRARYQRQLRDGPGRARLPGHAVTVVNSGNVPNLAAIPAATRLQYRVPHRPGTASLPSGSVLPVTLGASFAP